MMNQKNILLVEDNRQESQLLSERFDDMNYNVHTTHTVNDALDYITHNNPDIILVDLHLPDSDGAFFISQARHKQYHHPIIVLSSDSSETSIIKCLSMGADNYWCKPITFRELHLRVKQWTLSHYRQTIMKSATIQGYEINFCACSARKKGEHTMIRLRWNEMRVLKTLACHPGSTVPKVTLLVSLKQHQVANNPSERNLHNIISKLRKKLPEIKISSVSKKGFVLVGN